MKAPLLVTRRLGRAYRDPVTGNAVAAVHDVNLEVPAAGTLGILGASGAGKSTLTRLILGLEKPDNGTVLFDDIDLQKASARQMRGIRRRMQAVFQDPRSSLNPHLRVGTIIAEPLLAQGGYDRDGRRRRVVEALDMVDLGSPFADRRPERLSGGERQRVAIARAIAPKPDLVVLDEPVSSLDGPVRGRILHLLAELTARLELAIVMVSHDVRSVVTLTRRVMVMYAGRCVEEGLTTEVFENPLHPYTQALLAAVPRPGKDLPVTLDPTTPAETGCACRSWCPQAEQRCKDQPDLKERTSNHRVACWVK
jgi:peptide/nickel transport system ATP-binding protein